MPGKKEAHQAQLAITTVVWHELHFVYERLAKSARRAAIGAYLRDVVSLFYQLQNLRF